NKLVERGKGIDKGLRQRTLARLGKDLRAVGTAVGLLSQQPAAYLADRRARLVRAKHIDVAQVEAKLAERTSARAAKDYARADALKAELAAMGVQLHDRDGGGTYWSVQD
ncbi:MAG: cysteine--tRNA ligase, partial [Acidobacteriota bacterium]